MILTRAQRDELSKLSLQLFGSATKWQSLLSRPEFRVITETKEDTKAQKYISLHNSKKSRTGTVMKLETAIAKGLFKGEKGEERLKTINENPVKQVSSRAPTFEELKASLIDNIDLQKLSRLAEDELCTVAAYRLINGNLFFPLRLMVQEPQKADFDKLLANLNEDARAKVEKFIPDAENPDKIPQNAVAINGLTFLKELTMVIAHPQEAEAVYISLLHAIDISPKPQDNRIQGLSLQQYINKANRQRNEILRDKLKRPEYYAAKEARAKAKRDEAQKAAEAAAAERAKLDAAVEKTSEAI